MIIPAGEEDVYKELPKIQWHHKAVIFTKQ